MDTVFLELKIRRGLKQTRKTNWVSVGCEEGDEGNKVTQGEKAEEQSTTPWRFNGGWGAGHSTPES